MNWKRLRPKNRWRTSVASLKSTTSHDKSVVNYQLSAAYVSDAMEGRFYKSGLGKNLQTERKVAAWCIRITSHFTYIALLFLVASFHCVLSALEYPQMIAVRRDYLDPLAFWGGVACCLFYITDITALLICCKPKQYFTFTHGKFYVLCVILISSDYVSYIACGRMIFRALRPLVLIFRIASLRNTGLVMLGVTPKFLQFLLIVGACVSVFSVIGVHLFMYTYIDNEVVERQHDGIYEGAFDHLGIAVLEVFVLMAGGSYPRFMIPAYDEYGPIVLSFFVTIIMVGEIILYGILVAKIFDFYVDANKKHVKEERHHERQCLIKAFEILDNNNTGSIAFTKWKGLMQALKPKASSSEITKRFRKLKDLAKKEPSRKNAELNTGDIYLSVDLYEFFHLPNVLQFTVEKAKTRPGFQSSFSEYSRLLIFLDVAVEKIVFLCRKWFFSRWSYYISLVFNVLFLLPFTLVWYGIPSTLTLLAFYIESILLLIIAVEVIAQFIAMGVTYMLQEMPLHVLTVAGAIGCFIYSRTANWENWNFGWPPVVAYLCMLIRLTSFKRRSSSTFHWLRRIAPPFFTLFCLTIIAFYTYGVVGMECFGNLETDSEEHGQLPHGISLCRYGFETLGCSLLTLFQISLGSSWHKVMHYIMDEHETTRLQSKTFSSSRRSTEVSLKRNSSSNASLLAAFSTATAFVTQDKAFLSPIKQEEVTSSTLTPPTPEKFLRNRKLSNVTIGSPRTSTRQKILPRITEEDLFLEDLDEVTLTGRKELGKWTHDILPDMTFLSGEDLKRLHEEMGKSFQRAKMRSRQRKRSSGINRVIEVK